MKWLLFPHMQEHKNSPPRSVYGQARVLVGTKLAASRHLTNPPLNSCQLNLSQVKFMHVPFSVYLLMVFPTNLPWNLIILLYGKVSYDLILEQWTSSGGRLIFMHLKQVYFYRYAVPLR